MAGDDDQPATKRDLAELEQRLRGELATKGELRDVAAELRGEIGAAEARLRTEMGAMERRLVLDLSGVVQRAMNIAVEQIGDKIGVVDEKYKDLPGRVERLERDVAELKARPPAPAPPATRRKKSAR